MNAKSASQTRLLKVGDCVRLKSGGPQGTTVRTSPGGKFRVAWDLTYFSKSQHGKADSGRKTIEREKL